MPASFLNTLRAGPPPPKVAFLPDGLFFSRAVPVAAGATPAEAAAQVELGLEAVSPFPLTQLYYGYYWTPGAERALVFAAYRRRFTADQVAAWDGADLVLPSFAAPLGGEVAPATTVLLTAPEGLTALHWESGRVPASVLFRPLPAEPEEATPETIGQAEAARAGLRDELIRAAGGSRAVIDLGPPVAESSQTDREVVFRADGFVSRFAAPVATALDVRDKAELAHLRAARRRDLILWRVAVGCVVSLGLLLVGELALFGAHRWQATRLALLAVQKPRVEKIMALQEVTQRIDELSNKRLLPFEMMETVSAQKPKEIVFTRAYSTPSGGLYTLRVEAYTNNTPQIAVWRSALEKLPVCEKVDTINLVTRNDRATFTLVVSFKPELLAKPSSP
jgi:hypothetical protein